MKPKIQNGQLKLNFWKTDTFAMQLCLKCSYKMCTNVKFLKKGKVTQEFCLLNKNQNSAMNEGGNMKIFYIFGKKWTANIRMPLNLNKVLHVSKKIKIIMQFLFMTSFVDYHNFINIFSSRENLLKTYLFNYAQLRREKGGTTLNSFECILCASVANKFGDFF